MTTIADDPAASLIDPPKTAAAAVSYLRVSTREQAEKGGTDEGFSIPAQREATRRKAEQLGAGIVEEFVDAGASAKSSDRPELMRMIQYVKANKVAYCIVHKVDRLARNRADDVSIHLALQQCGVMLVSATENIDETPSGMLLHFRKEQRKETIVSAHGEAKYRAILDQILSPVGLPLTFETILPNFLRDAVRQLQEAHTLEPTNV